MIAKEKIANLVAEKLTDDQFLVDITVSPMNVIHVMVDSDKAITINQIVEISRHVENGLDREVEDFELSVFSAGLTEPLKLVRQYKKNVGNEITLLLADGQKLTGLLKAANDELVQLEVTSKEKVEGSKKKELVTRIHSFQYPDIKEAKRIIKF